MESGILYRVRFLIVILFCTTALAQWQMQESHTKESLRGVSVVDQNTVWASGTHGTYVITTDGGKTWTAHQVPGAEQLDFRGVKAFGAGQAFLLAAGPGDNSRIYHTSDSGQHWELQFTNPEPKGFFDCIAFSDQSHGIVVGDPVNRKFQILRTADGGKNWRFSDPKNLPPALDGEGAFAASNSCLGVVGENIWFVTGGPAARVFHSADNGATWTVAETPVVHGTASQGIFSIAFKDSVHGVIAGGDYAHPDRGGNNLALTDDGGKTWLPARAEFQKYFSAIAYVSGGDAIMAVGAASAWSEDNLRRWTFLLPLTFNAIDSCRAVAYAVGANGSIGIYRLK